MSADREIFEHANEAKANFDDVYNAPDPRGYYRELGALDYRIPTEAKPIFRRVMRAMDRDRLRIVDIGCSYGVNAAMLRYNLTFADLVERYQDRSMDARSVAEVVCEDAHEFAEMREALDASFVGLDVAREAAGYARAVGLIDEAVVENLESRPMSDAAKAVVADADLIITTGAVGYVTERTFSQVLDAVERRSPWVATFSLRQFPFDGIAEELKTFDLQTERLENRHFVQRAFKDDEEREGAIEAVRAVGCDPEGLETTGAYFADFYLSRPRSECRTRLAEMGLV